ncbi:hypothetical protein OHC51_03545 [Stenotrophomonas indicatrix]|uniref:hypothetical protein n=1 Tax=Stenotrophomonas indicatrix TaxID=2045451 RepID=UPI00300936A0
MNSSRNSSIVEAMFSFVQLSSVDQKNFLDELNSYLFASSAQRRKIRARWCSLRDACGMSAMHKQDALSAQDAAGPVCMPD